MSILHPHSINITIDRCALGKQCLSFEEDISGSMCHWLHLSSWMNLVVKATMVLPANSCGLPVTTHHLQMEEPSRAFHDTESWGGMIAPGLHLFFWCRWFSATSSQLLYFPLVLLPPLPEDVLSFFSLLDSPCHIQKKQRVQGGWDRTGGHRWLSETKG